MKHWLLLAIAIGSMGSTTHAFGQGSVDPRAVEACQTEGGTFVQISECLPDAHVAVVMLDAFGEIYDDSAAPLAATCRELNKTIAGAAICVVNAIKSAIELAAVLPEGSELNDPIFEAVRSTEHFEQLESVMADARKVFPDKMYWGGGTYFPYR